MDLLTSVQRGAFFSNALNVRRAAIPWSTRHDGIAHSVRPEGRRYRLRCRATRQRFF
jgi:hypothetical protein